MSYPYQISAPGGVEILSNATISGSITANGGITVPSGYILDGTASYATTASHALNAGGSINTSSLATTGSNTFVGNQIISGSLTVFTGSAVELQVTNTGVTIGNIVTDTHRVTGSLNISGSTILNGNLIVSGNTTIGDATTDTVTLTAATMSLGSGTGILNIDSSTFVVDGANNRVGVGTTSPSVPLHVVYSNNSYAEGLRIENTNAGTTALGGAMLTTNGVNGGFFGYAPSNYTVVPQRSTMMFQSIGLNKLGFIANANEVASTPQDIFFSTYGSNTTYQLQIKGSTGNILVGNNTDLGFRLDVSSPSTSGSLRVSGSTVLSGSLTFSTPSSPGYNGEIARFGSGTLTTGQLYFYSSSGTWSLANANSTGSSVGMLGLALGSSPTSNGLLIRGYAVSSSYNYGTGSIVYMATSSGAMTSTSPSSSNHVVRVMGYQISANTMYFDPSKTWVTLA